MQRDQRHDKIFVQQEPLWFLIDGIFNLGTKAKQTGEPIHAAACAA
jgi:hypothetical protein